MANVISAIKENKNIPLIPSDARSEADFSYDTKGKTKPLKDKAVLLPSKIIGSPVEYMKDLKQDVFNIKKAAAGKANDHELGRINSLAMKIGSLGIASYLFAKSPFNINKKMEFAGFAAFFGSMALWPKLAIQLPLKARTGVDFMQEYVDSQGRKKYLYQDPKYVLTDMLPEGDLEKIGNKLNVSENLPDRENFIRQRAHKTALQANTLWMMSAGFASPVFAALIGNAAEKPLRAAVERLELRTSEKSYFKSIFRTKNEIDRLNTEVDLFKGILERNSSKLLSDENSIKMIKERFNGIMNRTGSLYIDDYINECLHKLSFKELDKDTALKTLGITDLSSLNKNQLNKLNYYFEAYKSSPEEAAGQMVEYLRSVNILKNAPSDKEIIDKLTAAMKTQTIGGAKKPLENMFRALQEFSGSKIALDKYISARAGERPDSFIANQWERITKTFVKSFKLDNIFSVKELDRIANRDYALMDKKMFELAANDKKFDKTAARIMSYIDRYEAVTRDFIAKAGELSSKDIAEGRTNGMEIIFSRLENMLKPEVIAGDKKGSLFNLISDAGQKLHEGVKAMHTAAVHFVERRVTGALSSFYRIIQAMDIYKQSQNGMLNARIKELLERGGGKADKERIEKIAAVCRAIIMSARDVDYSEKFITKGFQLTNAEFNAAMKILFEDDGKSVIPKSLENKGTAKETADRMMQGLAEYKKRMLLYVVNHQNNVRNDLAARVLDKNAPQFQDGVRRSNLIGKSVVDTIADTAMNCYNSKKWMQTFGGAAAAITAVTLAAGLMFGRKSKIEKQAEEESRKHV